ncbi:Threonine/homoserine/homoserine lactone efflux protein [Vibrio chagasii]|nr:Threonine/homoserine/homoserine lactone efflux protein [Vibrio chagasii]CAH6865650.1 Threonine/homoserine/homoserine lactone efflux protein [Vibrio chagasii]CAH6867854.1 Threonine/homoserine/homoserine lactone efflux protein [Vibrio chagasii]CAH7249374.1 Threonine/homoserine/homoserine lactone efflux protein [Vibrio chagasii]
MDYLLFLLICIVATFSPGPAVLLAVKNSAVHGLRKAMWGIGGNVAAMITMACLSAAGLGVVISASEPLYHSVKILGGLYLIYIGIKTWRSSTQVACMQPNTLDGVSRYKLLGEAYIVGVTNPKAVIFYMALFPQFIAFEHSFVKQFVLLTLTFAFLSFVALSMYAIAANKLSVLLMKEKVSKAFNRATGGIFIGFGLSLITSNKA